MIIKRNSNLWILELSIGFETNLEKNRNAKNLIYNTLIQCLKGTYRKVKFINLSLGAILILILASTPSLKTPSWICCPI